MCVKVISATHFLHPKCRDERARFGEFISHSEEGKKSQLFSHYRGNLVEGVQTFAILRRVCEGEIGKGSQLGRLFLSCFIFASPHASRICVSSLCPSVTIVEEILMCFSLMGIYAAGFVSRMCQMQFDLVPWKKKEIIKRNPKSNY